MNQSRSARIRSMNARLFCDSHAVSSVARIRSYSIAAAPNPALNRAHARPASAAGTAPAPLTRSRASCSGSLASQTTSVKPGFVGSTIEYDPIRRP